MTTFEKIANILKDYINCDLDDIKPETTFESLKIDSLDMVEIIMNLEEEFSVTVEDVSEIKTVGQLVEIIEENRK
ncbi:MAG: acyl carrier protein [Eubacteriales bacterium]|nr:acyl carrier protein [Eubacteriales bacterium]